MKRDAWQEILADCEATAKTNEQIVQLRAVSELYRRWRGQNRLNIIMMVAVAFFSIAETMRWIFLMLEWDLL